MGKVKGTLIDQEEFNNNMEEIVSHQEELRFKQAEKIAELKAILKDQEEKIYFLEEENAKLHEKVNIYSSQYDNGRV